MPSTQNPGPPDLGVPVPNSPSTTQQFAVSDPNLKPMEVNLPPPPVAPSVQPLTGPPDPKAQTSNVVSPQPLSTSTILTSPPPTPFAQATTPSAPPPQVAPSSEVFVNPEVPMMSTLTAAPALQNSRDINAQIPNANEPPKSRIPKLGGKGKYLILGLFIFVLLGAGAFAFNELYLNRLKSLNLISEGSQFYLSLAVKKAPQAEAAKSLVKKFPGGDKILKQFDKYYTEYIADDKKDPLVDLTQYATTELLFSRMSRADSQEDTSRRLFAVMDAASEKEAKEALSNFEDDKATYDVKKTTENEQDIYQITLQSEKKRYEKLLEQTNSRSSRSKGSFSTPKPRNIYVSSIENFLVSSDQKDDVKKAFELSGNKPGLGMDTSEAKSILEAEDHLKLEKYFPKENFLRFFQRDPITPYNMAIPFYSTSINTYANSPSSEAKTFQKVTRAVTIEANDQGATVQSMQLAVPDVKLPDSGYKISDSLATRLPKQLSGVSPTWFAETNNLKDQWRYQNEIAEKLKSSKSRSQREDFEQYLKSKDQSLSAYRKTYGIDYEKDILDWLISQTAVVLNAGSAKKGPEILAIAEISDKNKVETSLKKFTIPDYSAQINDSRRKSDIRSLVAALSAYYTTYFTYPTSLSSLVSEDFLRRIPTDPVTKQAYSYTVVSNGSDFRLSAKLDDGRTLTYSKTGTANYTGTEKPLVKSATPKDYNGIKIYEMDLYSYKKITYRFYFTVTDKLAVVGLSDADTSFKELIDFQKKGGPRLSETNEYKSHFDKGGETVTGLSLIVPINVWGFIDYLNTVYPEYKQTASSYSGTSETYFADIEKAAKGFLKTIPSVGSTLKNENDITLSKTLIKVTELPSKEKQEAESALERLLDFDDSNSYRSVLGIDSRSFSDKVKQSLGSFYENKLRAFISPSLLSN